MKKIVDFEICDIVPYSNGIIFAKKEMLDDNRCKVTFYGYDIKRAKPIPVTKSVYQLNKFGNAFKAICDNIGDYLKWYYFLNILYMRSSLWGQKTSSKQYF